MTLTRRRVELIGIALVILLSAGAALLFLDRHLDRSFISYRIAQNLQAGSGFAYNVGQPPHLGDTSSPLYALLLSLFAPLGDLPILSNLIGALAVALGGIALFGLARLSDEWTALTASALYVLFPLLWITLGLDVTLWMALCLFGVWLYLKEWAIPTALIFALALMMRPLTAVLILIIAAEFIATGKPFRLAAMGIFIGLVVIGMIWMTTTFGGIGPLPAVPSNALLTGATPSEAMGANVLIGMGALAAALFEQSPLWVVLPLLAAVGLLKLTQNRWIMLLGGWAILHLLTLLVLGSALYVWDVLPLIPALVGLAALGARWLADHVKIPGASWAVGVIGGALVMLAVAQTLIVLGLEPPSQAADALHPLHIDPVYQEAGEWLRDHTGASASVGSTRIGLLGYAAGERPMHDPQGILAPTEFALPPGDAFSWLAATQPDALVLRDSEAASLNGFDMQNDAWFNSMYEEAARFEADSDALLIYRRIGAALPITEPLVNMVEINAPLTLNRIGTDFSLDPLEGGRTGMVTLQWLAGPPISGEQYVAIRIQNREGAVAALGGRMLDFTGWPARTLITSYHTVDLAPTPAPGVYEISVGVGEDAGSVTWYPVVQAKVPFGDSVFLGGISGARQQFGDITLIGYRLSSTPEAIEVLLLWQAVREPIADYKILIQVRDMAGAIVAQTENEPYNGAYPTSAWSAGEQVPDTTVIPISALPAGDYQVFAGLIAPDGVRLRTQDGLDVIFLGRLTVQAP